MDITRSNSMEFERGVIRSTLFAEQIGGSVDGFTIDDINQVVVEQLSQTVVPLLNRVITDLDLVILDRPTIAKANMTVELVGDCKVSLTVTVEVFADINELVVSGVVKAMAMAPIASAIVAKVGLHSLHAASTAAGYEEMLRAKVMERNLGSLFAGLKLPQDEPGMTPSTGTYL